MPFIALLDHQEPPMRGDRVARQVITVDVVGTRPQTGQAGPASHAQLLWRLPGSTTGMWHPWASH